MEEKEVMDSLMQSPLFHTTVVFCVDLLVLSVILVILLSRRRALHSVKLNSPQYNTLLELNRWYAHYVDKTIKPEYPLSCECFSREKCERFDFFSHMLFDIEQNLDYYKTLMDKANYNQNIARQYQASYQKILQIPPLPAYCVRKNLFSYKYHVKLESKLVEHTQLVPVTHFSFQVTAYYVGSLGRKYRRTVTFSLAQIAALYKFALENIQLRSKWQEQFRMIQ